MEGCPKFSRSYHQIAAPLGAHLGMGVFLSSAKRRVNRNAVRGAGAQRDSANDNRIVENPVRAEHAFPPTQAVYTPRVESHGVETHSSFCLKPSRGSGVAFGSRAPYGAGRLRRRPRFARRPFFGAAHVSRFCANIKKGCLILSVKHFKITLFSLQEN